MRKSAPPAIFKKGKPLFDFLFVSLDKEAFVRKGQLLKEKFALQEQILSFKVMTLIEK